MPQYKAEPAKGDNMENANTSTKCTDINSLAEKNQRLVEQVELISVSNYSHVIKELNDTVLS